MRSSLVTVGFRRCPHTTAYRLHTDFWCWLHKLLTNASYFAFTATPKNKTLETFGVPYQDGDDVKHRPFHVYTMKQAIQEGFILDVLKYYTPIASYYKLMKTVQDDPMFDKKRAQKKLRSFVESDSYTIRMF